MADPVDIATEMMQEIDVSAISAKFNKPSEEFCIECDIEIPLKRQQLGGVERCIHCQELEEKSTRSR